MEWSVGGECLLRLGCCRCWIESLGGCEVMVGGSGVLGVIDWGEGEGGERERERGNAVFFFLSSFCICFLSFYFCFLFFILFYYGLILFYFGI